MIAVSVQAEDEPVVREFFELFKTPWEFFDAGSTAEVLLCAKKEIPKTNARLVLVCNGEPAKAESESNGQTVIHLGCNLFAEVRELLTCGQPVEKAGIPTLDLYVELIRNLLVKYKIPFLEIPPVPAGHDFIVCLTHDCDHVGIRNHKFDHTFFGFIYRATFGSLADLFRGKKSFAQAAKNFQAVCLLPLVHLGLAKDFWFQFDAYAEIESGLPSTFFLIPKKGETGIDAAGRRPAKRAARYDVKDLSAEFEKLKAGGKEMGLHGIDAWRDASVGREEKEIISKLSGETEPGVRMHWLFFDEKSPANLEAADFAYDSTVGYNQTIGYRAGTAQVFKPLATEKLLELPLHIMDTALFYPSHLNLNFSQAEKKVEPLIQNAVRLGGVLTVNWHDRSLAPERLWGSFYLWLLTTLKEKKAWFATASQTVAWFRQRREVFFESENCVVKVKSPALRNDLPGMRVRIFNPAKTSGGFLEMALKSEMEVSLAA